MQFVTYVTEVDGEDPADLAWRAHLHRTGVLNGELIHELPEGTTLADLLGDDGDQLVAVGEAALAHPQHVVAREQVRLLPPLPHPPTIRDFMTFEQHVEPSFRARGVGVPDVWYEQPVFYFTNPYAAVGAFEDIHMPPGSRRFDFEAEVAALVGRPGRNLNPEQADQHIVGYMIMNDWSARDLQAREREVGLGPVKAKDSATTLGPVLVTRDELEPFRSGNSFDLGLRITVNGELFGEDRLSNMLWSFGEMIAYASRGTWVRPGDLFGSGTCGSGCLGEYWSRNGVNSRPSLQVGDTVEIVVDHLGSTCNRIVAGEPIQPLAPRSRAVAHRLRD